MSRHLGNNDYLDFDNDSLMFIDDGELIEQTKIYKRSARQEIDDRLEQRRIRDEFGISEADFAKLYH